MAQSHRSNHNRIARTLVLVTSDSNHKNHCEEKLEKLRRHVRILVDIGKYAGGPASLQQFLDQTVKQVSRAVEIHHVKILRYRRSNADLIVEAGIGWNVGVIRVATLPADLRSAPGRAFQTAEPVTIKQFNTQTEFQISDFLKEHGIVSLANTPVIIDGAAWGVLEVDSTTPRDSVRTH